MKQNQRDSGGKIHMKIWTTAKKTQVSRLGVIRCSCYIIMKDNANILVDTGIRAEREPIEKQLENLDVKSLSAIIITHAHADHAGNASYFQEKFHCPVYAHSVECSVLASGRSEKPIGTSSLTRTVGRITFPFMSRFTPCRSVRALSESFAIEDFAGTLDILETPGHTSGSISILVDSEIALVGDAMVHGRGENIYPPFANDASQISHSWEKLLNTPCRYYLPVHGEENSRQMVYEGLKKIR